MRKSRGSAAYFVLAYMAAGVYLLIGVAATLGFFALIRDVLGGPPAPAVLWSVALA